MPKNDNPCYNCNDSKQKDKKKDGMEDLQEKQEFVSKAAVMRIINAENAVALSCCIPLKNVDQAILSIVSQINELPVFRQDSIQYVTNAEESCAYKLPDASEEDQKRIRDILSSRLTIKPETVDDNTLKNNRKEKSCKNCMFYFGRYCNHPALYGYKWENCTSFIGKKSRIGSNIPGCNPDDLKKINALTNRDYKPHELYVFEIELASNDIGCDYECFTNSALWDIKDKMLGKTGSIDLGAGKCTITARIFETKIHSRTSEKTKHDRALRTVDAKAYIVRTAETEQSIREIEDALKKDCSISCAILEKECSICGKDQLHETCAHVKGKMYDGELCYHTLYEITDCYEWSLEIPISCEDYERKSEHDAVNHPNHYTQGGIECIEALKAATTGLQGIEAVSTANAIKYLWRWKEKNGAEDIRKAIWYCERLLKDVSEREEING